MAKQTWQDVGVNFSGSNQAMQNAQQGFAQTQAASGGILDRITKEEMFKQEQANKAIEQQRLADALMLQRETAKANEIHNAGILRQGDKRLAMQGEENAAQAIFRQKTLENQALELQGKNKLLNLQLEEKAREKKVDADIVKALSFDNTKTGEDKEVMVPTGAKILDTTKIGSDVNKKYEKLLPTVEESSYMDEAQKLKSMNKEQQDDYFKQKYLASEEAKKAGVDKTKIQKIDEVAGNIAEVLNNPASKYAQEYVVDPILNWNKPESEKLLAGKPKVETAPKTFEQYRAEEEDKILKADTKRETLEKKIFEENSSPEIKKEIQKGKKELLSTQELAKSLTGLDPKAQKVILEGQQKLLVAESEKAQKVQEKAQEQVWKERTETLKANLDVEKARLIEAQKNPIKNKLEIQEVTAKINKLNLEAAKMKKEGSSWFGKDVADYIEK